MIVTLEWCFAVGASKRDHLGPHYRKVVHFGPGQLAGSSMPSLPQK